MVKLTAELMEQAGQYTNAVRDREKLDGFPLSRRLKTLLVNNNRIWCIGEALDQALPYLTELILTNNSLVELGDLDPLASLKSLTYLSILRNPVTNKKHYRLYVICKVPQVRVLDFQKVKLKERQEHHKLNQTVPGNCWLELSPEKHTRFYLPLEGSRMMYPRPKSL
uniref:U2A'/phosphoprotein 32 family A C-terminal domain-containing protein n=1 Tax=Panthera tigris altaica TaxID=74533 RepID=A0A8C9JR91_PANTA